ncbi:hypothetical protein FHT40_003229 [Mycolicibacterium sp. BK556]|uniref:hypothetical protein n=1 Tax=unclassified Mycolicibacterium TaxID=2636767 RepID=UPI0016190262|nr:MULTISPECIES: hypothetical protein [unclassified Mycolicibacterium]MBB3603568.1 hypothetical protein [Mycolicibacterium sp. BK556]MBB3633763.1 hypothetical protein [Mycolicibacterium sp. BK607]
MTIVGAAVVVLTACSNPIVTTKETDQQTAPPASTTASTRPSNDKLVNAFDYYLRIDDVHSGYYFTSPSGSWRCVIVPRTWAGCQSSTGTGRIGVAGAPQTVTDDTGQNVAPNSIVVRTLGDPQFAALPVDQVKQPTGTAKTLPFNKILAAAGFHCNVQQETGISCISEQTGNGFTFSNTGVNWQYTDVP